ncbi:ClpX C4-type zinc finger protein [Oceanobacillus timonensis]|uniref:ClpX C4-type zinc finger protein n=1 Tax=Oceanobacillus timonensis TaxID=1926285 RepID=UPI003CCC36C4
MNYKADCWPVIAHEKAGGVVSKINVENGQSQCSFCDRNEEEVRKLVAGSDVNICKEVLRKSQRLFRKAAKSNV